MDNPDQAVAYSTLASATLSSAQIVAHVAIKKLQDPDDINRTLFPTLPVDEPSDRWADPLSTIMIKCTGVVQTCNLTADTDKDPCTALL